MPGATPEELAEFCALSAKVAGRKATDEEVTRWRTMRERLAAPPSPPPSSVRAAAPERAHARMSRKLRLGWAAARELHVSFADEVSAGGLRVITHEHLEAGTLLVVRLELAGPGDPEPLTATARVAWSRREGGHFACGLELTGLRPEERERLEAFGHAQK